MSDSLEVTCEAVQQKLQSGESFLLLDCREQDEYDTVHIDEATLLPMSELADRVGELEDRKQDDIVVYCHHGMRSLRVTNWLRGQGFANVVSMTGGIDRWSEAIDPSKPRY
ncbi:MAG: rhodanese-like domain-containing protein [Rubinisphaera brasiliensis]|uniref:Rhodanese-like protein n=1 Tax=Rubinisphaera brasiliensis (strain ATCC 49424 / DSM 5305 / JCM 21570 / IAM 15109 / NBRC 103401 / IFAM 1448) TaxID=756272 RepID=F0SRD6_RUBBR|nr:MULTISPECIES: rhodanese-like domain-containing protein [Rubinisphaera]ADY57997.1 Rhodanese-like protein [Rubinisphaera brasiliensis DSM 5305]MBR9804477.1 rhodanese [bacterium]